MLSGTLNKIETITPAPQVMTFTDTLCSISLASLLGKIPLLLLDPGNTTDHSHTDGGFCHRFRSRNTHTPIGGQHADMQVFDCLAIQLHCNRTYFNHHHH